MILCKNGQSQTPDGSSAGSILAKGNGCVSLVFWAAMLLPTTSSMRLITALLEGVEIQYSLEL